MHDTANIGYQEGLLLAHPRVGSQIRLWWGIDEEEEGEAEEASEEVSKGRKKGREGKRGKRMETMITIQEK